MRHLHDKYHERDGESVYVRQSGTWVSERSMCQHDQQATEKAAVTYIFCPLVDYWCTAGSKGAAVMQTKQQATQSLL